MDPTLRQAITRRMIQVVVQQVFLAGLIFLGAWSLSWSRAWLLLGLHLAGVVANGIYALPRNPAVVAARGKRHEGTRTFDKVFAWVFVPALLAVYVLGGMDGGRFHWLPLPGWALIPGIVLYVLGCIPITWALGTNPHLEPTARIQTDRDHKVVDRGPYRWVRHPMYLGMLVDTLGMVLILGSGVALACYLVAAVAMVARTVMEDRMLRADLPGYAAYAERTRSRLLPGIW
ncbi:MAG: isoprenylcysteine carboxylmethyltransferase family protein [Pseudomonadota bacterium]